MGGLLSGFAGGTIGGAVVKLYLDSKQYQEGLAQAEAKGKTYGTTMGRTFSKLGIIGTAAFIALGTYAVKFATSAVQSAIEVQQAHDKMANTIANAAQLAGHSVSEFTNLADSIRALTGVDDEQITVGEALLGQMGLTADQIKTLTPLVVDLSVKNGIDLNAAFKAVGKAAEGSTGALARYIGPITKGATAADTYQNVLGKLAAVQGYAAAQAKQEPWKLLASDFKELEETVGAKLLPVMRGLTVSLDWFLKNLAPISALVAVFVAAWAVANWEVIAVAVLELANNVTTLGLELVAAAPEIAAIAAGLGVFAAAADIAVNGVHGLQDALRPMADRLVLVSRAAVLAKENGISFGDAMKAIQGNIDQLSFKVDKTGHVIKNFAGLTNKALKDLKSQSKQDVGSAIGDLGSFSNKWQFTAKSALKAMDQMRQKGKQLAADYKQLANSPDWIPAKFQAWLLQQGPDAVHSFEGSGHDAQKSWVADWRSIQSSTDAVKGSINRVTGAVQGVPNTKNIQINVNYKYVGFDPTKPIPGH